MNDTLILAKLEVEPIQIIYKEIWLKKLKPMPKKIGQELRRYNMNSYVIE